MSQKTLQYVSRDRVKCDPQVRKKFSDEVIAELAQSILAVGILQPIQVRQDRDNFVVIDGELRLRAATKAGLPTVPVIVEDSKLTQPDVAIRQLISNCQRQDLSPLETASAIDAFMKATGLNGSQAAARIGKSSTTITRLLTLLSLPEHIRQQIDSGAIPISAGYELAKVAEPEKQNQLVAEITSGQLTRDGLTEKVQAQKAESQSPSVHRTPARVTAKLNAEKSVTVTAPDLNLSVFIEVLESLVARARQGRTKGADLNHFLKLLRLQSVTEK
jgi:ParB family transcriptional regulator, chromosome partitioning protein